MNAKEEYRWWLQRIKNLLHFFVSLFWVLVNAYPARKLKVVGVTGTDGKTTTSVLIYEMLKAGNIRAGLVTTVGSKYIKSTGEEILIDNELHVTTPEARILQPILRKMLKGGVTHVVLEATAHGLDQHRLLGSNIQIGVFTNLSEEHLNDFINMERYAKAKLTMFRYTKANILNQDDKWFDFFKTQISARGSEIIPYSKAKVKDIRVPSSLVGDYNRSNIAGATTAAAILGVSEETIKRTVENFRGIAGRREEIENGLGFNVFVDFAHTPNGIRSVLGQLRSETDKKLIAVFGATGERDKDKRPVMGKIASEIADIVIITSDDTRHEDQDDIARQIISGIEKSEGRIRDKSLIVENDRKKAIELAVNLAHPGDTVLIAGKGHERTINLGGREFSWSDADVAREALKKRDA